MKIISIANQKGGVGKSTISAHLFWYYQKKGKNVILIDFDPQSNSSSCLTINSKNLKIGNSSDLVFNNNFNYQKNKNGFFEADNLLVDILNYSKDSNDLINNFKNNIGKLETDIIIIDTAPTLNLNMLLALMISDYVISPFELSIHSINGLQLMIKTINNIKKQYNKNLNLLGIFISKYNRKNPRQVETYNKLKKSNSNLLFPCSVSLKSSYSEAFEIGVPVWDIKKTTAREAGKEILTLFNYINERIKQDV